MTSNDKIQILSKIIAHICYGLLFILPIVSFTMWLKVDWFPVFFDGQYDVSTFDIKTQAFGIIFSLLPLSIWMYGLFNLQKLFRNYAAGLVFIPENASYIKRFAWMSIIGGGLSPFFGAVYSLILSMNHAEGERFLQIGLGTTEIHTMLLGFVFVVIAHVMKAAHKLSEENRQFV